MYSCHRALKKITLIFRRDIADSTHDHFRLIGDQEIIILYVLYIFSVYLYLGYIYTNCPGINTDLRLVL